MKPSLRLQTLVAPSALILKVAPFVLPTIVLLVISACRSLSPGNKYENPGADSKPLNLSEDRAQLNELRKEVPVETRRDNDDLAFLLKLFERDDVEPSKIRQQFDTTMRHRREVSDREFRDERENFTRAEKNSRDEFLDKQKAERESFKNRKTSRETSAKFYKEMDQKRTDFFQAEREKRNDFESDTRDRRKRFEDFVREKQNWFNQEHRAYTKRFTEKKK